jgi:hypothetical protein
LLIFLRNRLLLNRQLFFAGDFCFFGANWRDDIPISHFANGPKLNLNGRSNPSAMIDNLTLSDNNLAPPLPHQPPQRHREIPNTQRSLIIHNENINHPIVQIVNKIDKSLMIICTLCIYLYLNVHNLSPFIILK